MRSVGHKERGQCPPPCLEEHGLWEGGRGPCIFRPTQYPLPLWLLTAQIVASETREFNLNLVLVHFNSVNLFDQIN